MTRIGTDTPLLTTCLSVPLSRSWAIVPRAKREENDEERDQNLENQSPGHLAESLQRRGVAYLRIARHVHVMRFQVDGNAGVGSNPLIEEGQSRMGLERKRPKVRGDVGILLALVEPYVTNMPLRDGALLLRRAEMTPSHGQGDRQQEQHNGPRRAEPSVPPRIKEFFPENSE
jgi:hypothetical protein